MTRQELIAKATRYAKENAGRFSLTGEPKFRESAIVCFHCECDGNEGRIEVQIDAKTGECLGFTFIPSDSSIFDDDYKA